MVYEDIMVKTLIEKDKSESVKEWIKGMIGQHEV